MKTIEKANSTEDGGVTQYPPEKSGLSQMGQNISGTPLDSVTSTSVPSPALDATNQGIPLNLPNNGDAPWVQDSSPAPSKDDAAQLTPTNIDASWIQNFTLAPSSTDNTQLAAEKLDIIGETVQDDPTQLIDNNVIQNSLRRLKSWRRRPCLNSNWCLK
ncbi:uncharacterized protein PHALS_05545 [Plasmopara halstedii]|uniref:Uncharacterized protein n=1 Tax=Plasmopara halstedii TaxID=4781 RepID=A0A0P1B1I8_PLAHL|nr:uncharacterized protein PHALS_05545 [Plasmopara halstedii]CEG48069.1 hypothetical protein PHALS_05545 [Plasmopara halstedii]|eukprot:XP_024584438.1 hypothetical protein PHALS_05545 [Plasmopara halstedii]